MCTLYRKTLSVYNISRFVSSSGSDIAEAAENAFILYITVLCEMKNDCYWQSNEKSK